MSHSAIRVLREALVSPQGNTNGECDTGQVHAMRFRIPPVTLHRQLSKIRRLLHVESAHLTLALLAYKIRRDALYYSCLARGTGKSPV